MPPFTPAGDRARWKVIYDLLALANPGDTVTYEAMGLALDLDPVKDRSAIQMAVYRAAREYLTGDLRAIEAVPNVGYLVVEASRQLALAEHHQVKGRRSIRRGREQVTYVDTSGLDEDTRHMFEVMAWKFGQQDEAIRRLNVAKNRMQRQLDAVSSGKADKGELDALRERLEKLEAQRTS